MRPLDFLVNLVRWTAFVLWSLFWMSAAILWRLLFTRDPNVTLSWARRFWAPGVIRCTGCDLRIEPGFVPQPGTPYVFVMNHQSMFDIPAAFVAIPVNIRFVAKKVLRAVPFLGWYMMSTGMIFVDRRNREQAVRSLEQACAKIRSGISILAYPEGTRAPQDGPILPFKKGPFVMAIQAGVPIVPVAIHGSSRLLPRDSLRVTPGPVRIILGDPIPTAGLTQDDREDLIKRVRDTIIDLNLKLGGPGGDKTQAIARPGFEGQAHLLPPRPAGQQAHIA
ncbi:MAG: lysophospholipid acyltransferase family protein [Myxococcales bacterium]|nr:1-acyl-sn-glycerol-3-phosphate acyltransferase [Myxococcota bacterium]MDW8280824.1 lysophospholipid acyltransferase family protein [Myxococcales bacterium]